MGFFWFTRWELVSHGPLAHYMIGFQNTTANHIRSLMTYLICLSKCFMVNTGYCHSSVKTCFFTGNLWKKCLLSQIFTGFCSTCSAGLSITRNTILRIWKSQQLKHKWYLSRLVWMEVLPSSAFLCEKWLLSAVYFGILLNIHCAFYSFSHENNNPTQNVNSLAAGWNSWNSGICRIRLWWFRPSWQLSTVWLLTHGLLPIRMKKRKYNERLSRQDKDIVGSFSSYGHGQDRLDLRKSTI